MPMAFTMSFLLINLTASSIEEISFIRWLLQSSWLGDLLGLAGNKRSTVLDSQHFFATRGKKSDSGEKRSLKPNSLFAAIGKKNTGFDNRGKRGMKPNSLFGTFGETLKPKRSMEPNSLPGAFSDRQSMTPDDLQNFGKRSEAMMPFYRLYCDLSIEWRWTGCKLALIDNEGETEDVIDLDNENEDDIADLIMNNFKRADADFWATRGKREAGNDFWATR